MPVYCAGLFESEWAGRVVLYTLIGFAGAGGLWSYWTASWAYWFYHRGFRARWLGGNAWVYDEFDDGGVLQSMEFRHEALGSQYAPPCRIELPTAEDWDTSAPPWARSRRAAILANLTEWFSSGFGAEVTFVPPGTIG
jgi:hypothetical protein